MLPLLLALVLGGAGGLAEAPAAALPHMVWADRLLREIRPADNAYGSHPTVLQWRGVEGAPISRNRTVCSSFITRLLKQAYGFSSEEIRRWLGAAAPTAADYYRAIRRGDRFVEIAEIGGIRRGDLVAIDYRRPVASEGQGGTPTGHLMLVDGLPEAQPKRNLGGRGRFYSLLVIDSSRSGHGPLDSRSQGPDGRRGSGVGRGTIGLLVDPGGRILAYSWSTLARSRWIPQRQHPLRVGRFCWDRCGQGTGPVR
jgi:hypothetical protein